MTWKHLGHHHKPIILLNLNGFWNPLLEFFGRIAEERMVNSRYKDYYTICNSTEEAASLLQSHNTKADTTP